MSARQLSEAITTGGIRSINFFNGRLLTAEDMTAEQAPRREADTGLGNCKSACNAKYQVEGVQFRLTPVEPAASLAEPALLRNRVAYECFGYPGDTAALAVDPFGASWERNGLLDSMLRDKTGIGS